MKLLLSMIACFFVSISVANAYLDTSLVGDAETSAGDQNSNLYKLNNSTLLSLKKLKKIDDAYEKNPEAYNNLRLSDLEKMVITDTQEGQKKALLDEMLKDVISKTKNSKNLIVNTDSNVYTQFYNISENSIQDRQIVKNLQNILRRNK